MVPPRGHGPRRPTPRGASGPPRPSGRPGRAPARAVRMLPYVQIPSLALGPVPIHPFGVLVAIAVFVGVALARWRARRLGLDLVALDSLINWSLAGGFLGAHILLLLFYSPGEVLARPWSLLLLW